MCSAQACGMRAEGSGRNCGASVATCGVSYWMSSSRLFLLHLVTTFLQCRTPAHVEVRCVGRAPL